MVITDFNLQNLRTRAFKGFVQFQDPENASNFLRLKERQVANITFSFGRDPHYSDSGIKVLDPSGHDHRFDMTLKVSSDLLDDQYIKNDPNFTGADQKTLSFWILRNEIYDPIQLIFVTTLEARNGDFLHFKYTLDPQTFGPVTLGASGGTSNIGVSGEVIAIEEIIKTGTIDAP